MRDAIAKLRQLDRLQHLGEQAPGVEGEDIDLGAGLGDGMQDRLVLKPEAGGEDDAPLDPPPHLPDAVGEALDPCQALIERLGLFARGIAAQRQKIAVAPLVVVLDARHGSLPDARLLGVGDLGGVESGAQQELREVGDQMADRPDLALEAVPLAQQHGEADAAPVVEHGEADGDGAGISSRRSRERVPVGVRLEHRRHLGRIGHQRACGKINQRHREPP